MANDATTEGGALVRIKVMATKLATGYPADGVDEVGPVEIFEPVLVRIMGVGTTIEVVSRRVLPTLLVTCILCNIQYMCNDEFKRTYSVSLLVEHEGCDSPSGVGTVPGLATDADSGATPAKLVLSSWNGASGHWHGRVSDG